MRVYELAKELGVANRELLERIRAMGVEVANHMSHLEAGEVDRVRRSLTRERHESLEFERSRAVSEEQSRRQKEIATAARKPPAARPPGRGRRGRPKARRRDKKAG